jgi:hypothetical protein
VPTYGYTSTETVTKGQALGKGEFGYRQRVISGKMQKRMAEIVKTIYNFAVRQLIKTAKNLKDTVT